MPKIPEIGVKLLGWLQYNNRTDTMRTLQTYYDIAVQDAKHMGLLNVDIIKNYKIDVEQTIKIFGDSELTKSYKNVLNIIQSLLSNK